MIKKVKKEASSLGPGGSIPLGKKTITPSNVPVEPKASPLKKKGYFPGQSLTGVEQELASSLQTIKRAMIVQSPKGDFKVSKNPDGTFSIDKSAFTNMISPRKMLAPDVIDTMSKQTNGQFRIIAKENNSMNINVVKKDLLRRKVQEYFKKNPKEKTVIISTNIGEQRTVWKVDKTKKGFNVVEVNTHKERFILEVGAQPASAPAVGSPTGGPPLGGGRQSLGAGKMSEDQFRKMDFNSKFMMLQNQTVPPKVEFIAATVADIIDPNKKALVANLRQLFQGPAKNITAVALFTELSQQPGLVGGGGIPGLRTSHKSNSGKLVKETEDEKESEKKDEKKPEKKEPKSEPSKEIGPSSPEGVSEPEPMDAGLETGATEPIAPEGGASEEPPADVPKTGEEMQLKHVVNTKPIKDIQVFGDDTGGHVMLSLGGLKNPLQLNFSPDGKITYKLGELSRVLKVGK